MKNRRDILKYAAGAVIAAVLPHASAFAQQPAAGQTKIIVAYPPGGSVDITARVLAPALGAKLGTTAIVDNRPGASGTIGAAQVARSDPDGSTMILASSIETTIQPVFNPQPQYDPAKDLKPVSMVGMLPYVLVVRADSPITSLDDLVKRGKAEPGRLSYASYGNFSSPHLIGEMLNAHTGIRAVHVPYKGSGPAVVDLLGGRVDFMFDTAVATLPQIQSGKMRALATTAHEPLPMAPDIPTVAALGYPDLTYEGWFGFFVPSGTPEAKLADLRKAADEVLGTEETRKLLLSRFVLPSPAMSEQQLADFLKKETDKLKALSSRIKVSE